jgi:S-adenosylmethionine:tRNA ribosyltransferase-isomerase
MLVLDRTRQEFHHDHFCNLHTYLKPRDLLVLNDTRVIPARIRGKKAETGGKVEFLMLHECAPLCWSAMLKASRRPAVGSSLLIGRKEVPAIFSAEGSGGTCEITFEAGVDVLALLEAEGEMPLPPYIQRQAESDRSFDHERYQTVYAANPGAVAAPTAGLHFTDETFHQLEQGGVDRTTVTLHVGLGTFKPVEAENLADHPMHTERAAVSAAAIEAVQRCRAAKGRVVAVGSTSLRTLESMAVRPEGLAPFADDTNLFIYPPYEFQLTDALLTNFHLPRSTLLMMVCAFAGMEFVMSAYREAVREGYRFYSYGDCMLVI